MNTYLRSARRAIDDTAGRLGVDDIARPAGGRWCISEILEHLTLAFRGSAATLQKALDSGELRARQPALKQALARIVVIEFGYFPRVEAPETTRPSRSIPVARALQEIRDALETLDVTLARTAAKFGEDIAVSNHPYFAGLSVHQWRKFHWRHTMHHMAQVRALTARSPSALPRADSRRPPAAAG